MVIPSEALARVDARIRALRPGECARVEVVLDAVRDRGGKVTHVAVVVRELREKGERFELTLREPV